MRRIALSSLLGVLLLALALSGPAAAVPSAPSFVLQTLTSTSSGAFAGLNGISCKSVTACVAVGTTKSSAQTVGFAAVLDGDTWTLSTIIQSTVTNPTLNGVWCASDTSCIAVGSHTQTLLGVEPLIETLSGTTWTPGHLGARAGRRDSRRPLVHFVCVEHVVRRRGQLRLRREQPCPRRHALGHQVDGVGGRPSLRRDLGDGRRHPMLLRNVLPGRGGIEPGGRWPRRCRAPRGAP